MAFDLARFSLIDMLQCGRAIRSIAADARTLDETARNVVAYLYDVCRNDTASQRCALVRFYKTIPYGELNSDLQAFAQARLGGMQPSDDMRCLTLLATAGQEPEWCDPRASVGHRTIPLASVEMVEQAPMISQLIRQMGLEVRDVVAPAPSAIPENDGRSYDVFHVEDATGSPYIPAQQFVSQYGVRSVLGFGGVLPDGEFFAVILFSRGPIPPESAARFRNIALDVKASIHPYATGLRSAARLPGG
jgi:hypothetical protein